MSVNNDGTPESAKNKLAWLEKRLEEYEKEKSIFKVTVHNEIEEYMNLNRAQLNKLSSEECATAVVLLSEYSYYLQGLHNIHISRVNWADSEIRRVIAPLMQNYNASSAEERKLLAIHEDDYAREVDVLKKWAQSAADRISFLANRVELITKAYTTLLQHKAKR